MEPRRKRRIKDHPEGRGKVPENSKNSSLGVNFEDMEAVDKGVIPTSGVGGSCNNCPVSFQNSYASMTAVWFPFVLFPNSRIDCH